MSQQLINLVSGVLGSRPEDLTLESGPKSLKAWDSLAHVTIIAAIEQTYGIQLTMPEMLSIRSIANLQQALAKHGVMLSGSNDAK
jgi:acyl carrier protein